MKDIYNKIISFDACYDPKEIGMPEDCSGELSEIVKYYRGKVKNPEDILWAACRKEAMNSKTLRLLACWGARRMFKCVGEVNPISFRAVEASERYALGLIDLDTLITYRNEIEKSAYSAIDIIDFSVRWMAFCSTAPSASSAFHDVSCICMSIGQKLSPPIKKDKIVNEFIDRLIKVLKKDEERNEQKM